MGGGGATDAHIWKYDSLQQYLLQKRKLNHFTYFDLTMLLKWNYQSKIVPTLSGNRNGNASPKHPTPISQLARRASWRQQPQSPSTKNRRRRGTTPSPQSTGRWAAWSFWVFWWNGELGSRLLRFEAAAGFKYSNFVLKILIENRQVAAHSVFESRPADQNCFKAAAQFNHANICYPCIAASYRSNWSQNRQAVAQSLSFGSRYLAQNSFKAGAPFIVVSKWLYC